MNRLKILALTLSVFAARSHAQDLPASPSLPNTAVTHHLRNLDPDHIEVIESFVPILEAQVEVTEEDPNAHLLDLDLGSNDENFKAWAWTDQNGHLSSKAYLELSGRILELTKK